GAVAVDLRREGAGRDRCGAAGERVGAVDVRRRGAVVRRVRGRHRQADRAGAGAPGEGCLRWWGAGRFRDPAAAARRELRRDAVDALAGTAGAGVETAA